MRDLLLLGLAEKGGLLVLGGDCIIKLARAQHHVDARKKLEIRRIKKGARSEVVVINTGKVFINISFRQG